MTEARPKNYFALICLVLALGTTALYWPITSHPFIIFDDEEYVTANAHVTSGLSWENFRWAFEGAHAANWHPLTWLSHQLDCTLFGLNAGGHHLVNLLFHVANTLLLFVFLRGATGAVWRSALVAALFAWHPLHVESVAWASERKDVLSTFFWLLTLMAYVRYARNRNWFVYSAALIFFALGLMSKPMVVTLPFVLLLLDFWPLRRITNWEFQISNPETSEGAPAPSLQSSTYSLLLEKIPFFLLAIGGCAATLLAQSGGGAISQTPLTERFANAALAYARYVAKTFWPTDLAIVYPHPRHWSLVLALGATALLAVWTMLCVRNWRRNPFLAFGWFWFLGTLVPTIGLIQVGAQSMADRYTYIPSIGFFIALVWGAAEFCATKPRGNVIYLICAGSALIGCLLTASIQISFWRDSTGLFLHALEVTQDNYVAANTLGKAFEKTGDPKDKIRARVLYREAVRLEPRYPHGQFNLAMSLLEFGETAEALQHLKAAADLEPRDPDIQFDLGIYFTQHASWTNAAICFSNSIAIRPDFAPAQCNFAAALANLGRFAEAAPHYREALRLKPDFTDAKKQLNRLLTDHPELR